MLPRSFILSSKPVKTVNVLILTDLVATVVWFDLSLNAA